MKRWMAIGVALLGSVVQARPGDGPAAGADATPRVPLREVTLERIMSDPEWIARSPERPYWSDDGTALYFLRRREGSDQQDLWRVEVRLVGEGAEMRYVPGEPRRLSEEERDEADVRFGDISKDRRWKLFSRDGDVFLKELATGRTRALTRTSAGEFGARFMADDGRVMFQRDGAVLVRDLRTGLEEQLVELRFEKDPEEKKDEPGDFLAQQQERLFDVVRKTKDRRKEERARQKEERARREARGTPVVYMGADVELREASASPSGEWMLVRVARKGKEGRRDTMPAFVTEDGYVRATPVRSKVGTGERRAEELYLVDLRPGRPERRFKLDLAVLPGITEDPLAALRKAPEAKEGEEPAAETSKDEPEKKEKKAEPKPRGVTVRSIAWSDDGSRAVIQVFSLDNKDRWIAAVDFEEKSIKPLERIHDEAWANGHLASLGWLRDNRTIWYLSEETGYSQIFTLDLERRLGGEDGKRRVTGWGAERAYEVSDVTLSRDGEHLYFTANATRPGEYELYRVSILCDEPAIQRLTFLGGNNEWVLSPDERGVAILHSDTVTPPELYVQPTLLSYHTNAVEASRVTHTVTPEYSAIDWIRPEVVGVPGRDGRTIWSRVFDKKSEGGAKKPVVVFVHGAGYLQDAHEGWSRYFREHLFHNLLCERGYVVIAPDYRASAGYGRDWRTAIYRRMGEPELEDVQDCVAWLVRERGADPGRVGIYGGSYGGFLTLMAMFTRPEEYACGAALRPVTDWAHYNDGYTSNILNTPQADPEAYRKSSPIEYAEGLRGRLLICHGMLDDNVFFQDTVRLVQRLIELKKENWEAAMYPIEAHGFKEPTSWLDEYRRIDKLFRETLEGNGSTMSRSEAR